MIDGCSLWWCSWCRTYIASALGPAAAAVAAIDDHHTAANARAFSSSASPLAASAAAAAMAARLSASTAATPAVSATPFAAPSFRAKSIPLAVKPVRPARKGKAEYAGEGSEQGSIQQIESASFRDPQHRSSRVWRATGRASAAISRHLRSIAALAHH